MKKCFAGKDKVCRDLENGLCYRMENSVAQYRPYMHCRYMEAQKEPEKKIIKAPVDHGWTRVSWGLIACNQCNWDFPGGSRKKENCPNCGQRWR